MFELTNDRIKLVAQDGIDEPEWTVNGDHSGGEIVNPQDGRYRVELQSNGRTVEYLDFAVLNNAQ